MTNSRSNNRAPPRACKLCHNLFSTSNKNHKYCRPCYQKPFRACSVCHNSYLPKKSPIKGRCIKCQNRKKIECLICKGVYVVERKPGISGKICRRCNQKRQTLFSQKKATNEPWIQEGRKVEVRYWVDKVEHSGSCDNPQNVREDHYEDVTEYYLTTDFKEEDIDSNGHIISGPIVTYKRDDKKQQCCDSGITSCKIIHLKVI